MKSVATNMPGGEPQLPQPDPESEVLRAIREIEFGSVEVVVHQGAIREIRQIRKHRIQTPAMPAN